MNKKVRCMFCKKTFKNRETAAGVVGDKMICVECSIELADTVMHAFWDLWDEKFDKKFFNDYLKEWKVNRKGEKRKC